MDIDRNKILEMTKDDPELVGIYPNLRIPAKENDYIIEQALQEAAKETGIKEIPQLLIYEGSISNMGYHFNENLLIVPEHIAIDLNKLELKAILTHELGHKQQDPLYKKIDDMDNHFKKKGRFNNPRFVERYEEAHAKLCRQQELDADNLVIKTYGAEVLKTLFIKTMILPMAKDVQFIEGITPENIKSGEVSSDEFKATVEDAFRGKRSSSENITPYRFKNTGSQLSK